MYVITLYMYTYSSQRLWPVAMFFTVIVGVPWLLWRLLASAGITSYSKNYYYYYYYYYYLFLLLQVSQSDDENSSMWYVCY